MKKSTIKILLLLAVTTVLRAQSPNFRSCGLEDAFPKARVELMYEDRNSIMWFGSTQGLFLYDGLDFIQYLKADTNSQHVRAIYQDRKNTLWVGYEDGSIYSLQGKQLKPWQPEEGTPKVPIIGFAEDSSGRLWIATYGEGVYYSEGKRLYNFNTDDGLSVDDIYVMAMDASGRAWLGSDAGISICSVKDGKKRVENLTREDGLPDEIVREILPDASGDMWIGTFDEGVCLYKTRERRFEFPFGKWQNGVINKLELFKGKELWIGTDGNGLWRYSLQDKHLQQINGQRSLEHSKIYDLHRDREGNIWVVSNSEGIIYANRQFEFLATDVKDIQAVVVDAKNRLWMGTPSGLFYKNLNESNAKPLAFLPKTALNVISLYLDANGRIWVGTFGNGVLCFDPDTGHQRRFTEKDGLTNDNVLSIAGVNGHVWLATLGGVSELENTASILDGRPVSIKNYRKKDGLSTDYIYKVLIDSKKRTWFATDGQGISMLENGKITNYSAISEGKKSNGTEGLKAIYSITEDHEGNLWLSTASDGVYKFDGSKFSHLSMKEGINELAITSLATDAKGRVIVVHQSGVDVLTPGTGHLIYYDEELGLGEIEPHLNSVCTDQNGNIWMGVKTGLIRYTPLNEELAIDPRTRLESVSVSLRPIDFQTVTQFNYGENNFTFNYIGLWYTDPASVRYRYKLEGFNNDWIESKDRQANFPQLPPGKYTFKVTSTENDAWRDETVVAWSFEIAPPIWRRWWFVLGCALLIGGLFLGYVRWRDARRERVFRYEKEKVESELAVIKAQIDPHFLFNSFNTLIAIIEEDPPSAVEYVEQLSDFYRSVLQLRDKELIPLEQEADLVEHYGYLLKKRYGDNFSLNLSLHDKQGYVIPLCLQLLVENAVKHNVISKQKPLRVDITLESSGCVSVVNNLQPKVHPEASTKFGLDSLQRRYEMLSGKLVKVEKTETQFRVCVPVIA